MQRITEVPPIPRRFRPNDFSVEQYEAQLVEDQYREGIRRETETLAEWLIQKRKVLTVETVREFLVILENHISKENA